MLRTILVWMARQIGDDRIEVLVFLSDFALGGFLAVAAHESFGHRMAAGKAASAAVGVGQHLLDIGDARVFFDVEELRRQGEQNAKDESETR